MMNDDPAPDATFVFIGVHDAHRLFKWNNRKNIHDEFDQSVF